MKEDSKKKQIIKISVLITSIFVIFLSVTYAFINQTLIGAKRQVITAGYLRLELEEENSIFLENALPTYDETGMIDVPFVFRLRNQSVEDLNYNIRLVNTTEEIDNSLNPSIVKYGLTKDGVDHIAFLSSLDDSSIDRGKISAKQVINYQLRLWIDSSVENEEEIKDKVLKCKIEVVGGTEAGIFVEFEGLSETKLYYPGQAYGMLPVPKKEGYIFNGWYNSKDEQITETSIVNLEDKKLTAKWNKGRYVVSIDPKEGTWNESTAVQTIHLDYEETKEISNPTRRGYTFQNWQVSGSGSKLENTIFTMGSEDAKLTAIWKVNQYMLTVNPTGGVFEGKIGSQNFNIEYLKTKEIEDPTKEGYTFIGWDLEGEGSSLNSKIFTMGTSNVTLTAKWKINQYKWISYHYQQNVNGEGYTKVDASTGEGQADFGSQVTPSVLSFLGFTSPLAQTITIQIDSNPPVKNKVDYHYTRNQYNLTINPNGGNYDGITTTSEYTMYYEATKTIKNPTKLGYIFTNWSVSNGTIQDKIFTMSNNDSTLTANWEPGKYIVTFNPTGGSVSSSTKEVTYLSTYGIIPTPIRSGYQFLGWFTEEKGGTKIESTTSVSATSNHMLYARWKAEPSIPELTSGMIPVTYNETTKKWQKANTSEKWYDYDNQWWANAVTVTEATRATYMSASAGTPISIDDINTMWVWIPRYEYQYTNLGNMYAGGTQNQPGEIKVNFITKSQLTSSDPSTYKIPEGFNFGGENLSGFWIGKFEMSGELADARFCQDENSCTSDIKIAPNQVALESTQSNGLAHFFYAARSMQNSSNATTYGFDVIGVGTMDVHLIKNTEWGAVAMLSQSRYGKYGNSNYTGVNKEVYQNQRGNTGNSSGKPSEPFQIQDWSLVSYDTPNTGYGASTTGTIYGVYDMSGGYLEYVMANYDGQIGVSHFNTLPDAKYYDLYISKNNTNVYKAGDATYETSGWYNDGEDSSVSEIASWILRSGYMTDGVNDGIFQYKIGTGNGRPDIGGRVIIKP